jgi:hypothetical protein
MLSIHLNPGMREQAIPSTRGADPQLAWQTATAQHQNDQKRSL